MSNTPEIIRSTLLELLEHKPYQKIAFKEIAEASSMSRQNLYYYYKSKDSVMEDIMEEFLESIYEAMIVHNLENLGQTGNHKFGREFIKAIVEAIIEHENVARILFSDELNKMYITKQVAFLNRMLGSVIRVQNITVNDSKYIHYLALQISGASYMLLREWLLVNREFPVERIVELGYPLVGQIVDSLRSN